jgi:hypothetical protein
MGRYWRLMRELPWVKKHTNASASQGLLYIEESLDLIARPLTQDQFLGGRFNSLGNDSDSEGLAQGDDGLGDRLVIRIAGKFTNEGAIKFQGIDRKLLQL